MREQNSVLANMGAATWSAEDGTAYEVALEGINHVVGAYSGRIREARAAGDSEGVRVFLQERTAWSQKRRSLSPVDRRTVDALTAEAAEVLASLRGGAR
ncbi:hypothetical protein ACFFSH_38620 [Streptomyces filamentosus]|uniref:Uncharacterized protein n=1 Tax=Streptomyces filamentosus TaxID=67294 RepID=A0A919EPR3_STRFL|nr:hypothetical protein [Streptomyces filamentosus]GHG05429.1 hypothetical protein GCM10017667_40320 [Streptomyces filamentosus]